MVGLKIEDDRKFQDVALLVDREDFLTDLEHLRSNYNKLSSKDLITNVEFIQNDVFGVVAKYKYPPSFNGAVFAALTKNEITDKDLRNVDVNLDGAILNKNIITYLDENTITIKLPIQGFSQKKMTEAYKQIQNKIKNLRSPNHPLSIRLMGSIRNMRKWYWKRKSGIKTNDILKTENSEYNTVDKYISEYSKLLKSEI